MHVAHLLHELDELGAKVEIMVVLVGEEKGGEETACKRNTTNKKNENKRQIKDKNTAPKRL